MKIRDRIKSLRRVKASDLLPHPATENGRLDELPTHPAALNRTRLKRNRAMSTDQPTMKFIASTLAVVFLLVATVGGCGDSNPTPERFQCIERINRGSLLYRDTETGEVWIYCSKGCMASDTWAKVEAGPPTEGAP